MQNMYILVKFRLASAYEDKFRQHTNEYYGKIAKSIEEKYGALSFKTFIQMILDKPGCRLKKIGRCDNHWKTYLSKCGYCDLHYQYFVRSVLSGQWKYSTTLTYS